MKAWKDLGAEEQLQLRLDYQAHLDQLPPTCSLDDKVSAFARWLAERDVSFSLEDVSRRTGRN